MGSITSVEAAAANMKELDATLTRVRHRSMAKALHSLDDATPALLGMRTNPDDREGPL